MFKKKIYQSSFINYFSNSTLQEPPKDLDPWLDSFSSWSHAQRLCAIDLLIGRCHPTQVRHMMAVIEPQFQRDFISLLPKGKKNCKSAQFAPKLSLKLCLKLFLKLSQKFSRSFPRNCPRNYPRNCLRNCP